MLKIAIVEKENYAKDIVFHLSKIIKEKFCFAYYEKISDLVKDKKKKEYDLLILNEAYNNIRVSSALELSTHNASVIYCQEEDSSNKPSSYSKVFHINVCRYKEELNRISMPLENSLKRSTEFYFSYNGVKVKLRYRDIYYIEKQDKNLIYYTTKGEFTKRGNVTETSMQLEQYDFIRIHSGLIVNFEYIYRIEGYELELHNKKILSISRTRKSSLEAFIRKKVQ